MGAFIGTGKRLMYRDQTGADQAIHAEHWRGFTFQAGPVIVCCRGFWGQIQVWAASEAEGRRVIHHAADIADLPVDDPSKADWVVTRATAGRNGQPGTFRVATVWGLPTVTKRKGPSGPPLVG
jgi:hypothetical protein